MGRGGLLYGNTSGNHRLRPVRVGVSCTYPESVPDYEVHTVVSSDPDKVHKDLPDTAVVDSVDELLSNPDIDVVIITSPNATHYEYTRLAIEAGKHVVVEKPFTVTSAEADQLIDLAKQKGVLLTVYHNRRWDNDFLTVRNLLETGALGKLSIYQAQFSRYRPEVQSGGGGNREIRVRHSVRFRFTFDRSGPVPVRSAGHAVGGFENGAQRVQNP